VSGVLLMSETFELGPHELSVACATNEKSLSHVTSPSSDSPSARYRIVGTLGRGSFGEVPFAFAYECTGSTLTRVGKAITLQVFRAVDRERGDEVALKRIFISQPEKGIPLNVLREYKALQILDDEHIVALREVFPMVSYPTITFLSGLGALNVYIIALILLVVIMSGYR
jgi:serine/threonine protein kinase